MNKDTKKGVLQRSQHWAARERLVTAMLEGHSFQDVNRGSPVPVKRAMAYRLLRAVRTKGSIALQDGRHGHPSKLRAEARAFLEASCRETPCMSSRTLQAALQERFNLQVSVSQINRVRAALGVSNPSKRSSQEKKQEHHGFLHP
jgi:transposase